MNLDHEQAQIIKTALDNYRAELYINNNDTSTLAKVNDLAKQIEIEMQPKDLSQKKVLLTDGSNDVGSETGIERDYALQNKPNCEVCDD